MLYWKLSEIHDSSIIEKFDIFKSIQSCEDHLLEMIR